MEPGYFWGKTFEVYGPEVHIKTSENLIQFKSLMKNWNDNSLSCTVSTKNFFIGFIFLL